MIFMKDETLTIAEALPIAERHIATVIAGSARLSKYAFMPVRLRHETDRYWVFSAPSPQSQAEGRVPGAVSACVDKVDGHIWSTKEHERYAQSRSPFPPPPKPVNAVGKEMLDIEDALDIARRALAEIIRNAPELQGREFSAGRLTGWNDAYWMFSVEDRAGGSPVSVYLDPFYGHILSAEEVARAEQNLAPSPVLRAESIAA